MTERLTAAQAAAIAEPFDVERAIDEILQKVRTTAQLGKRSMRWTGHDFGTVKVHGQFDTWPVYCRQIVQQLRALGYSADVQVEYRQFADIWLEVKW